MNKYKIIIYLKNNKEDTYIIEAQDFDEAIFIEGSIELEYNANDIKNIDITII